MGNKEWRRYLWALILIFTFSEPCVGQDLRPPTKDIKIIIAEGVGAYTDDKAKARDDAITDACRRAIEQAVGLFVKSDSLVKNFQLIEDNIYTNSKGYIKTYEVTEERVIEDLYWVKIKAEVWLGKLDKDLDSLWDQFKVAGDPRFMVIIEEKHPQGAQPVVESTLIARLVDIGIKVIDPRQMEAVRDTRLAKLALAGDVLAAKLLALQQKAEMIITGKAFYRSLGEPVPGIGLYSCDATVDARAIKTDTAYIVAAKLGKPKRPQLDLSVEAAAEKALIAAANDWVDQNLAKIVEAVVDPTQAYQLIISNVQDFAEVDRIDSGIRNLRFTRNTVLRDYTLSVVQLEVYSLGTARRLAGELEKLKDVRLKVKSVTANTINLTIVR